MSDPFSLDAHFADKEPVVRQIYDALTNAARQWGAVREEPKKTSIHLANTTAFAGIATRKSALILTLKSDHPIKSARVHRSEKASANRYHEEIKLSSPAEVDDELINWLKAAYTLTA
jgi:hypothetical protein